MKQAVFALIVIAGMAQAQSPKPGEAAFQYLTAAPPIGGKFIMDGVLTSSPVTGRPFSATERRHSLQVLSDGTRLENTDTDKIYRDAQGRTRVERKDGSVTIQDPLEGSLIEINTNDRTVRKASVRMRYVKSFSGDTSDLEKLKAETAQKTLDIQTLQLQKEQAENMVFIRRTTGGPGPTFTADRAPEAAAELLGMQVVNGVNAEGQRNTINIPAGQIGNDRPMKVLSERWFSNDLQMVIRTTNSDPRFGDSSFELTDISQGAQDPSLFVVPAGFTDAGKK